MTKKRAPRRSNAGRGTRGVTPHSVQPAEITAQFIKWGIIGELPDGIRTGNSDLGGESSLRRLTKE